MKLLILSLIFFSAQLFAQQKIDEYKDYKPCTECFDKFKNNNNVSLETWKKSGLGNYGIAPQGSRVKSQVRQRVGGIVGGIAVIFISAITYSIYNQANKTASGIR